jgi:pimeloyl-ACP methyl ester carboxylesterase
MVFVDATHEALDSPVLAWLPAIYSVLGFACRARFVRRWFIGALCPSGAPPGYRAYIERRLNDPVNWPIGLRTAGAEGAAIPEALARLRTECPELPQIPVHVLTAGRVRTKSAARVHQAWEAMTARAPAARYTTVPTSGHYMSFDAPDVVIEAILGVVAACAAAPAAAGPLPDLPAHARPSA